MKMSLFGKRLMVLGVSALMALGNISPAVWQVNAEEPENGSVSDGITWEKVDSSEFEGKKPSNPVDEDLFAPDLEHKGIVRVSIVLDGNSTVDAGYSAQSVAEGGSAKTYRAQVLATQKAMEKKISAEALGGKQLDVVWNLTLAANIISANVPYARIGLIKGVDGVKDVVIENRYEAVDPTPSDDPDMAVASDMTGTTLISSDYTGAGQSVAIIDTGIDTDHRSFDAEAFDYALSTLDEEPDLLTKDEIAAVFDQLNVSAYGDFTADDVYISTKIPFAFNYVDGDLDVTHDNDTQSEHGSHVAGIAAANRYVKDASGAYVEALESVKTQGQAPDAQILAMKVFGKGGGAYDSDYFAAIEDAMVLGAASANLSLGSSNPGLAVNTTYADILDRFTEEDINVVISQGNNSSWATNALLGYLYSDDASMATDGSPGSYTNSFTVASVDNDGLVGPVIKSNGTSIYYSNGSEAKNVELVTIAGEQSYIAIDGFGTAEEMAALSDVLPGKIAVVSRGTTSFFQKANAAVENGAIATIIYNNQPGTISMNMTGYLYTAPAVSITQEDGQLLKDNAEAKTLEDGTAYYEGTITIVSADEAEIRKDGKEFYTMSDFSSWGTTGDLNLKPDITAPGGNIYSVNGLIPGGQSYELMSGTSMAAPQVAGLTALMHQYIAENDLVNKTGKTVHQLTQSLLMSTANPVFEEDTQYYYSVLKQGAGLANIADATSAKSVLEVKETAVNGTPVDKKAYTTSYADHKIKALLGADDERTGKYTVTFDITNFSDEEVQYRFNAEMFTQDLFEQADLEWLDEWTTPLDAAIVNFTVDGEELANMEDPGMYDFNDDGVYNVWDAQALLEYVVGTRESISDEEYADLDADEDIDTYDAYLALELYKEGFAIAEPGQTITVTAAIDLNGSLDDYGSEERNGAYVEGYIYAIERDSEEGVEGIEHSIPVLGYFGNWSEPPMTDKGSFLEYAYEEEDRPPYMYTVLGPGSLNVEAFGVSYAGINGTYLFGGNPIIPDENYHPERNAINAKDTLSNAMYTQIRNAGGAKFTVTDEDGNELTEKLFGPSYSAYYHANQGKWMQTTANTGLGYTPTGVEENSKLFFSYTMAPEYFVTDGEVDWDALDENATMSIEATVDNTAPELVGDSPVRLNIDAKTGKYTSIEVDVKDNQYVAGIYLAGENLGDIGSAGAFEDAQAGETRTFEISFENGIENHLYLDIIDYAYNETIYKINLNQEELDEDVAVTLDEQVYYVLKNSTVKATATVTPWAIGDAVEWTTGDESIATVDEDGIITGKAEGVTTVTATSKVDENASATAYVSVSSFDIELNGIVWDENGEVWMSGFNTNNLPEYTKLSGSMKLGLASAAYDQNGTLYAASLDSENMVSTLYTIDEATYTAEKVGDSSIGYMDICKAPSLGENILLGVYGPYVVLIDATTGDYLGAFDFEEDTGGKNFTGIAYEEQYYHPSYGNTDWVWLIDETGMLYELGTLLYGGRPANFGLNTVATIAKPVDIPYFQSLYYDGTNIFYSRFNEADNKVELIMVEDIYNVGNVWTIGYFADGVWPVGGLYQKGVADVGMSVSQPFDRSDAVIEGYAEKEVVRITPRTTAKKGGLNVVTNVSEKTSAPVIEKVSASPVEGTQDTFTVTVRTDDEATNGLYTVTYDPEMVELISTKGVTKYNAIKDDVSGEVRVGFINEEALDADAPVADLVFKLKNDEKRTEIKVTSEQENEENTGAEDTVVIGPEKDVSYSFASGNDGTWTKESGKTMDFRIKRSINENRTADHFKGVYVDGKLVDPSNYTIGKDGFTIILKPEFLEKLAAGKHTLKVEFDDGSCETTFTIEKAAPNTSDSNSTTGWLILMLGAALIAAAAAFRRKFSH